jgi:hypothetical protein
MTLEEYIKQGFKYATEYILCLYLDNKNVYRNYVELLKTIASKYNIEPYNNYNLESFKEILTKTFLINDNDNHFEIAHRYKYN